MIRFLVLAFALSVCSVARPDVSVVFMRDVGTSCELLKEKPVEIYLLEEMRIPKPLGNDKTDDQAVLSTSLLKDDGKKYQVRLNLGPGRDGIDRWIHFEFVVNKPIMVQKAERLITVFNKTGDAIGLLGPSVATTSFFLESYHGWYGCYYGPECCPQACYCDPCFDQVPSFEGCQYEPSGRGLRQTWVERSNLPVPIPAHPAKQVAKSSNRQEDLTERMTLTISSPPRTRLAFTIKQPAEAIESALDAPLGLQPVHRSSSSGLTGVVAELK